MIAQGPCRFQFDGIGVTGFEGDTLASALLARGQKLMGRSFKYHRPRGVLTAGSEEPNALVTVGRGADVVPNVRATQQEIFQGLEVRSQNAWPSLETDLMEVNDLFWPFLGAGFYYKTFMWPRGFWERFYEPLIRRAAGLGALSGAHDGDRYEKAFAFCDVLVIGAGPTGLMAAMTAARAGADVILAEEDSLPGGRLNAETHELDGDAGRRLGRRHGGRVARDAERARDGAHHRHRGLRPGDLRRAGAGQPAPRRGTGRRGAGVLLAHRGETRGTGGGRFGAPHRFREQRPAGHHDGRGRAGLSQPLGRGTGPEGGDLRQQ